MVLIMLDVIKIFLLSYAVFACQQESVPNEGYLSHAMLSPNAEKDANEDLSNPNADIQDVLDKRFREMRKPQKISAHRLDDEEFSIYKFSAGMKVLLDAEAIILSFKLPENAQYAEILRCSADTYLVSGTEPIKLEDINLMDMTAEERSAFYRRGNYFDNAMKEPTCELVSATIAEETFEDSWTPDGSHRWIIRACVAPELLLDKDKLTNRNCSRRIAISNLVKDYKNERAQKQREYLREVKKHEASMDQIALKISQLCYQYQDATKECEDREHKRAVSKKKKDAIITIAAASVEVAWEIRSMRSQMKEAQAAKAAGQKAGSGLSMMDFFQFPQATAGSSLGPMFSLIATTSNDIPRSCERALRIDNDLSSATEEMKTEANLWDKYKTLAESVNSSSSNDSSTNQDSTGKNLDQGTQ